MSTALKTANNAANKKGNSKPNSAASNCPAKSCQLQSMVVKCGHSDRGFMLDYSKGANVGNEFVIQVIAGHEKSDGVKFTYSGKCTKKHKKIDSPHVEHIKLKRNEQSQFNFVYFFKKVILPSTIVPESTYVNVKVCSGGSSKQVKIEAFPSVGWSGGVTISYKHGTHKDSNFNQNRGFTKLKLAGEWKISGEISAKYDRNSWKLGGSGSADGSNKNKNKLTENIFDGAQKFLDVVGPLLGNMPTRYGKVNIEWPKLSIVGGIRNAEVPGKYEVGVKGNVEVKLDPFIGVSIDTDILNWIIFVAGNAVGGYGDFLVKVKEAIEEGGGNEVVGGKAKAKIVASIEGKISGGMKWEKVINDEWNSVGGDVTGVVGFGLEGIVEVSGRFFWVSAAAGASMSFKSADGSSNPEFGAMFEGSLTKMKEPSIKGKFFSNGLAIYYTKYVHVGVQVIDTDPKKKSTKKNSGRMNSLGGDAMGSDSATLESKKKEKILLELFGSGQWPKDDNQIQNGKSISAGCI